ncbi:MAG: hypothetical protein STSR0008_18740 [Ignavibacterium sp.]
MLILIILVICFISVIIGKKIFNAWFNHVVLYSLIWSLFLILYDLKLIRYDSISTESFFIYFVVQVGILSGALTIYFANDYKNRIKLQPSFYNSVFFIKDFKLTRILIIITTVIGLISAYQNWTFLLHKFGSIESIMIRAHTIYRLRIAGELDGATPYLSIFPYVGIIFSGIYTAAKSKITLYSILPLISIIISDAASVGRGGIFVGFIMLGTSFLFFRSNRVLKKYYFSKQSKKPLIIGGSILFILVLTSLSLVSEFRGRVEDFKGKRRIFNKYDNVPFFSVNEYFYFSSNVGVFSKYFKEQKENPMIGENSFLPIYNFVSKLGFIDKPNFYPRGYNIPNWSNSATYLRDLHADFGITGMFLIPFLMSLFATSFWFKWIYNGGFLNFIILIYLFVLLTLSIFNMQTRSSFFLLSFILILILNFFSERFLKVKSEYLNENKIFTN